MSERPPRTRPDWLRVARVAADFLPPAFAEKSIRPSTTLETSTVRWRLPEATSGPRDGAEPRISALRQFDRPCPTSGLTSDWPVIQELSGQNGQSGR